MNNRTLLYFMDHDTDNSLLPSDSQVSNIKDKEWYNALKPHFNDLIWEYYADRVVFIDSRFKCDDDAATLINKIKRSFAILLKTKDYTFDKLYETTQLEYNPLWNVDGVVGTIHEQTYNDTTNQTKSGSDTLHHTGDDDVQHRGDNDMQHRGDDDVQHRGYDNVDFEKDTQNYTNTYDSTDYNPPAEYPESRTHETDEQNKTTYNSNEKTLFNSNEKTYFNSNDKTLYNSDLETEFGGIVDGSKDSYQKDLDLVIRQGNIGVTKSTELLDDQRETVLFDFFKTVVHECVNTCTYAVD